jgi:hypothetical protein
MAPIRKMVFRHGHKGPWAPGCPLSSPTGSLTRPERWRRLVDLAAGVVLSTWLMNGERPTTRRLRHHACLTSPYVDDDAILSPTHRQHIQALGLDPRQQGDGRLHREKLHPRRKVERPHHPR